MQEKTKKHLVSYLIIYLIVSGLLLVLLWDIYSSLVSGLLLVLLFIILPHRIYLLFKNPKAENNISGKNIALILFASILCIAGFFMYLLNENLYWPGKILFVIGLTYIVSAVRNTKN